ncbi:MAG: protease modulator HflC [Rhodospirillales bacterium]
MKNNLGIGALILAVVVIIVAYSSFYVVSPTDQAIVRQFGKVVRVDTKPGPYLKVPLLQDVVYFSRQVLDVDVDRQEIILLDQKRLDIDAYARLRITDPLLFFQRVQNEAGLRARLGPVIQGAIRRVLGDVNLQVLLTNERTELMQRITQSVATEAKGFGVEVLDVRLKRVDLPIANSEAVYQRMASQRDQEAKQFRGEGQQESLSIRANADREQAVIIAEAKRTAEIVRGLADAQAIKIYADAFTRDPEFFAFYRSLDAYRNALTGDTTTLVLSPDSEFFRYFNGQSPQPGPRK